MISKLKDIYRQVRLRLLLHKLSSRIDIDDSCILYNTTIFDFREPLNGKQIKIGKNSVIGCNFILESRDSNIFIGDRVYINSGTNLISINQINIGNDVMIGWGCYLYDHNAHSIDFNERINDINRIRNNFYEKRKESFNKKWSVVKSKPITICDKVWIGFNSIILKGVTIGEGSIVAAGSVVTRDVPPYSVVAGNPAVVMRTLK